MEFQGNLKYTNNLERKQKWRITLEGKLIKLQLIKTLWYW